MFDSNRRVTGYIISLIILMAAVALVFGRAQRQDWQSFQRKYFARTGQPAEIHVRQIVPQLTGEPELCTTCHLGLAEISPSHPVAVFGCVSCHGGNGLSLDETAAHTGLRGGKNPSDLRVAAESCGENCHNGFADESQNHVDGVLRSVQGTYAGGIAQVRFAFGAQASTEPVMGVYHISDDRIVSAAGVAELAAFAAQPGNPIEQKFAENCLDGGCHLSAEPRAEPYFFRSTGCAACHVLYDDDGLYRGDDPTIPQNEPGHMATHTLTTAIPFSQCNHCHNRGNYSLRQMDFLLRDDLPPAGAPLSPHMPAEGKRLVEYYQPIGEFTQCEWELDCIDCHTAQEAMGDGDIHPNQREMQYTQCKTCHGTADELPALKTVTEADETALRQAALNPNYSLAVGETVVVTERGELMGNIKQHADGQLILTSKVSGETYPVNPVMGSGCQQNVDEQESHYCHQCHAVAQ